MTTPSRSPAADAAALAPCPFCGGTPRIVTRDVEPQGDPWYGRKDEMFVLCDCGACLFDGAFHEGFYDPETTAPAAWNRRTAASELVAGVQAEPTELLHALQEAADFISNHHHGDNCYVSDHYSGDPGNRCNCGKDSAEQAVQDALTGYPEAMDSDGEPLEIHAAAELVASSADKPMADVFTVNFMRLAGLDKVKARECEAIVRQVLASSAKQVDPRCKGCDIPNGCPEYCRCTPDVKGQGA